MMLPRRLLPKMTLPPFLTKASQILNQGPTSGIRAFLGAKGLTSPEQTATGVNTPGSDENRLKLYVLMYKIVNGTEDCWKALKNSCCKDKKRRLEVLQIKNNLKNSIYNILRKLKVFKVKIKNVLKELEVHK
ncbi:hypothetical protein Tco_0434849 [Tanacetum coccineum]